MSHPPLWTDLDCVNLDKTHVYLERSMPLPVNLSLYRNNGLPTYDPFLQIIPHTIGRLKSLSVGGKPENLQDITDRLSQPAPLLEELSIHGGCDHALYRNPVLASTLFNGDLSSLRKLCLEYVRTELPWRNMTNLTSLMLSHTMPGEITVEHLLDFFKNALNLQEIELYSAIPTSGAQAGRLVSLACLEWVYTTGGGPSSLLLDHLLIPVGARLTTEVELPSPPIADAPPRFFDNLRNLHNFTTIRLYGDKSYPHMQFSGPNGEVGMTLTTSQANATFLVPGSLALFDTSKVERLEIVGGDLLYTNPLYCALLPMSDLRTFTLYRCRSPHIFIRALHPDMRPSRIMVCPNLEGLVLNLNIDKEDLDIRSVIEMVEVRASRGAKLRIVRIIDRNAGPKVDPADVLELRKHVWDVDYGPEAGGSLPSW